MPSTQRVSTRKRGAEARRRQSQRSLRSGGSAATSKQTSHYRANATETRSRSKILLQRSLPDLGPRSGIHSAVSAFKNAMGAREQRTMCNMVWSRLDAAIDKKPIYAFLLRPLTWLVRVAFSEVAQPSAEQIEPKSRKQSRLRNSSRREIAAGYT